MSSPSPGSERLIVVLPRSIRPKLQNVAGAFLSKAFAVSPMSMLAGLEHLDTPHTQLHSSLGVMTLKAGEKNNYLLAHAVDEEGAAAIVFRDHPVRAYNNPTPPFMLEPWTCQALGLDACHYSGKGVKVAVLDSGYSSTHADFSSRAVATKCFNDDASMEDENGHGTHCLGIIAGPRNPAAGPRYGMAPDAELFVAKVLGKDGSGMISSVIEALDWAFTQHCDIASLALGWPDSDDDSKRGFEEIAQRCLDEGLLVVAAAGNESARPLAISSVSFPALLPSVFAVTALDRNLQLFAASNRSSSADGGEVNIAAPGVSIYSSVPLNTYEQMDGTSMATSVVSGAAALWCEAFPGLRGRALWKRIVEAAKPQPLPQEDVGSGLISLPP